MKHLKDFYQWVKEHLFRKNNVFPAWILSIAVIVSITHTLWGYLDSVKPNFMWEITALISTLIYTVFVHGILYKNGYFEHIGGNNTYYIGAVNFIFLLVIIVVIVGEINDFLSRPLKIGMITISCILYTFVNWRLFQLFRYFKNHGNKEMKISNKFKRAVLSSDLPLTISYVFLLIIAIFLHFCGTKDQYMMMTIDYFFSGAIAFKMMLSNTSWLFIDDDFYKNINEIDENWCCEK